MDIATKLDVSLDRKEQPQLFLRMNYYSRLLTKILFRSDTSDRLDHHIHDLILGVHFGQRHTWVV